MDIAADVSACIAPRRNFADIMLAVVILLLQVGSILVA